MRDTDRIEREVPASTGVREHGDPILDVYIGSDRHVSHVADVCAFSIRRRATISLRIRKLDLGVLVESDVLRAGVDPLASTEFTYSRFLTPFLNGFRGLCMFCDNDFLFLADVAELVEHVDRSKAVSCVQHDHQPAERTKLDGRLQTVYARKNWSSLMIFDGASDLARAALSVEHVNARIGPYLQRLTWAPDEAIGALPYEWNWLEGHDEKPAEGTPKAVHFTRGGPWLDDWAATDYAELWRAEETLWERAGRPSVPPARPPSP